MYIDPPFLVCTDGHTIAAIPHSAQSIIISADFGNTWVSETILPDPDGGVYDSWSNEIACSSDCATISLVTDNGLLFISTNGGHNWTLVQSIFCSHDTNVLTALYLY